MTASEQTARAAGQGRILAGYALAGTGAALFSTKAIFIKLAYSYERNPYLTTFFAYRHDPFALPAFLINVPLFYGPVWLLASALPVAIAGFASVVGLLLVMKLCNFFLLAATGFAIYQSPADSRDGVLAAYLFLANPLVVFEGIANAHNDVLMTALIMAALFVLLLILWSTEAIPLAVTSLLALACCHGIVG